MTTSARQIGIWSCGYGDVTLTPSDAWFGSLAGASPIWTWTSIYRYAPSELRTIPTNVRDGGDNDAKWVAGVDRRRQAKR